MTYNHSSTVSEVTANREKEWEGVHAAFWVEMWVGACFHFGIWLYFHMLGVVKYPQKKSGGFLR